MSFLNQFEDKRVKYCDTRIKRLNANDQSYRSSRLNFDWVADSACVRIDFQLIEVFKILKFRYDKN